MTIVHAVILSMVEGITEFLPVSSTGHMILTGTLLHIQESEFTKSFEIIIQLGAILAVLVLYWKKLFLNTQIFARVAVAFIPTAVVGLVLYNIIKTYLLSNPFIVVWSLGLGGALLILLELFRKEITDGDESKQISMTQAFIIGCAQSLSVIPGVSRAAATIAGGLMLGLSRKAATEFSFLLAVPTMTAATGLDFLKAGKNFSQDQYGILGIGLIVSFITALVVVRWFIGFVKTNSFIPFGIYRILVALLFLLLYVK
jgi:undecaprenyl-diphosphatase